MSRLPSEHYKLSFARLWAYRLLTPLIVLFIRVYWMTCRIHRVIGEEHLANTEGPVIPCYWHQKQLFCSNYLLRRVTRPIKIGYLVSPSKDGELVAMALPYVGARAIRGSATRTGAQAIRNLYHSVVKDGLSPVMTPDGSTGPIFEFKPGPVMLAQLSGAPLLPITYAAKRAWHLNSWDKFVIPKPFTKVVIAIGPPRYVKREGGMLDTDPVQKEMQKALNDLGAEAEAALA